MSKNPKKRKQVQDNYRKRNSKGVRDTARKEFKRFDVEMIRRFHEQLLLEMRLQYFENLESLKKLENADLEDLHKLTDDVSRNLVERLNRYASISGTFLLPRDEIDPEDAEPEEIKEAMRRVLNEKTPLLDQFIGHLEQLRDIFELVLKCAEAQNINRSIHNPVPVMMHRVSDILSE